MVRHYTQLEIINLSKLPPTTVKRWLEYFSYFVPGTRQGDQVLYPYETLKLLKRISEPAHGTLSSKHHCAPADRGGIPDVQ